MSNSVTLNGVKQKSGVYKGLQKNIIVGAPKTAAQYCDRMQDLPVSTPSLINRDTEIKALKKNMAVRGGFDGDLWQPPRAGRIRSTGEIYIFDGDHSRHLYIHAHPEAKTMPVQVIDVDCKGDIHSLFVQTNSSCKTSITSEQILVHNYHAGSKPASDIASLCAESGLFIYCSHEEGGSIGDLSGVQITLGHLNQIIVVTKEANLVKEAKDLILSCKNPFGQKKVLSGPSLRSLCQLFVSYPELRPSGKCGEEFAQFFIDSVGNRTPIKYFKIVERDCRSGVKNLYRMAVGIVSEIIEYQKDSPGTFAAACTGNNIRLTYTNINKFAKPKSKKA